MDFTFDASNSQFSLMVGIEDDQILEDPENFAVRAVLQSTDAAVTVDPDESTVTILDNDGKHEQISDQ